MLEDIIAILPGNIYWMDREGFYLGCNNNQAKLIGLKSRNEIIGKRNIDIPGFLISEALDPVNEKVMASGEAIVAEELARLSDGSDIIVLSNKVPIKDKTNTVIGMVGISIDITDRKKFERELVEAKEKAEIANQAKTEFLYNMRHDIRTPFSGILGMARCMADCEKDPVKKGNLTEIANSADVLLIYLNEILEFTQIDSGNIPVLYKKFSLKDLVEECVTSFLPAVHQKHLELITHYDLDLECLIGDKFRIQRVLLNLIGNAVKFTEKGSILVKIGLIKQENRELIVKLEVIDTGCGIPQDKQDFIFEKFGKLNSSYNTEFTGVGLGLMAVKDIVDELDGDIEIESTLNKGSTFTCLLPFKMPLTQESKQKSLGRTVTQENKDNYKVLLVEDSKIARIAAEMLLKQTNIDVDSVIDGETAVEQFKSHRYDFILLDIGLPDINGYAVASQIRAHEKEHNLSKTPIIIITAHESSVHKGNTDVDETFYKPLSKENIYTIISTYLEEIVCIG